MLLYGAGGHGRVVQSCVEDLGAHVSLIFDDRPGGVEWKVLPYTPDIAPLLPLTITVGDNHTRKKIASLVKHPIAQPIIHPSCVVAQNASIGQGTVVLHRAIIQTGVKVGQHVIVNTGAIIEHDCSIADFAHIAPGVVICGGVQIGEATLIGAGSVVVPGINIGNNCLIKAGSVVTRDVPDNATVGGNPAMIERYE